MNIESIKLIGGILGIIAFFWKLQEYVSSYLQIELRLDRDDEGNFTAVAILSNKRPTYKRLKYVFLLVGEEKEDPVTTAQEIAKQLERTEVDISNLGELRKLRNVVGDGDSPVYVNNERAVIPLPFFYREQRSICDETLRYRCTIDKSQLKDGVYSVRLFVFPSLYPFRLRRGYRSTQDLFVKE